MSSIQLPKRDAASRETPAQTQSQTRQFSWADIDRTTARIANALTSLGLSDGARVAVQVEKSPEALLLYLACLRAGLVYLPLNTAYREAEIDYFLGNAEPEVVVCSPANESWIKPIAARRRVGLQTTRVLIWSGRVAPYSFSKRP